jgi:hypothetical protein
MIKGMYLQTENRLIMRFEKILCTVAYQKMGDLKGQNGIAIW